MTRSDSGETFVDLAVAYIDHIWPTAPPNSRRAAVVNLAAIAPKFVRPLDRAPDEIDLQRVASTHVLLPRAVTRL